MIDKLRKISGAFFLKKHKLLPETMELVKSLYPAVDWSRVDFYEGLPWFTPFVAPYVTAQALPDFYSFSRFRIYLKKFDEKRAQCLADIVHEGMHIMQSMHYMKGYGFGFLRGFLIRYIAFFGKHGYRQNPFETPAYDQEYKFLAYCNKFHQGGIIPEMDPFIINVLGKEPDLIIEKSIVPVNRNFLLIIFSFLLCSLIAIVKPLIDLFVFIFIKPFL